MDIEDHIPRPSPSSFSSNSFEPPIKETNARPLPQNDNESVNETHKKCQFCAESILKEAVVCKHCGREINHNDSFRINSDFESKVSQYLEAGYEVTSLLKTSANLTYKKKFKIYYIILIIILPVLWPCAFYYIFKYLFFTPKNQVVIKIDNSGSIICTGFTLDKANQGRPKNDVINLLGTAILVIAIIIIIAICVGK